MKWTLRMQILTGLVTLLCILLVAATIVLWPRAPRIALAHMVPAEHTLLLATNMTKVDADALTWILPSIANAPLAEEPKDIALLKLEDGTLAWVSADSPRVEGLDAVTIAVSDERARALLHTSPLLEDTSGFQRLRFGADRWMWIGSELAQATLPNIAHEPFAIATQSGTTMLAFLTKRPQLSMMTESFSLPSTPLELAVQTNDLRAFVEFVRGALSVNDQRAAEALIKEWSHRYLGNTISLWYDLLPQLDRASFYTGSGASAIRAFTHDPVAMSTTLHAAFRETLTTAQRSDKTFDTSFSISTVYADSHAIAQTDREQHGWNIHETTQSGSAIGLFSATRGNEIVLATDANLLNAVLDAPASDVATNGTIARGRMDIEKMNDILNRYHIQTTLPLSQNKKIQWNLRYNGGLMMVEWHEDHR